MCSDLGILTIDLDIVIYDLGIVTIDLVVLIFDLGIAQLNSQSILYNDPS